MYGYGSGYGIGEWVLMGLAMVVFWGAIVTLIIVLVRRSRVESFPPPPADTPRHSTALDILAERFARGEIDEEEFASRRRALLGHPE